MDLYEGRTGLHLSYPDLVNLTGLSLPTVQSLGSRDDYNPTLEVVELLCSALGVGPAELLSWEPDAFSPPYNAVTETEE